MAKKKSSSLPVASNACSPYKPTAEDKARERRYRAEDDIRTMQRADEIKKDKERVSAMKQLAKEQMEALKKVSK